MILYIFRKVSPISRVQSDTDEFEYEGSGGWKNVLGGRRLMWVFGPDVSKALRHFLEFHPFHY